ncbi:MAG TPA: GspE/PulE family protein [bacterium]|nr:GspE/PulE family protein [bacterium]
MTDTKEHTNNAFPDDITGEIKLGEILRDVGLISAEKLDELKKASAQSGESLGELLRKEVTIENLMALLNYEVPLPFRKSRKKEDSEEKSTGPSAESFDAELHRALDSGAIGDEDLGFLLTNRGIITGSQLDEAQAFSRETGIPLWRSLLNMKMVTYDQISDLTKSRVTSDTVGEKEELIAELLVNTGLLAQDDLDRAREEQRRFKGSLVKNLLDRGAISMDEVGQAMEKLLHIPYLDLSIRSLESKLAYILPEHVVRKHGIIPVKVSESTLTLGMIDPLNMSAIRRARMITGLTVKPCLVTREDWRKAVDVLYSRDAEPGGTSELESILSRSGAEISSEDMSAVQLASAIIEGAINTGATDVHLEPQQPEMRVRYRVDGMLYDVMSIPQNIQLQLLSRLKLLSDMNITEKRKPQDGHFTMHLKGRELNFRTSSIATHLGEKMTIRFLDEARVLTGLKQLGLEPDELNVLEHQIRNPHGLMLVTGPIGSGKTTTLYAALNQTNILNQNVVTIEDPVEYRLPGINQIQVQPDIGLNFEACLRSVLRHDADVIMVGEIRDGETARVATWAALTGQLVFGTLHTRSAVNAITMMINLGVEPYLLASALTSIVAQRLVRKLCPDCSEMVEPPDYIRHQFGIGDDPDLRIGRAVGCPRCYQTGYTGRTGIYEVLVINDELRRMILDKRPDSEIETAAYTTGMRTLWQNGVYKVLAGITTPEEVLREIVL